jgi:hypothetical protein
MGEKRGLGSWLCLVARVDGGTELWRPGSVSQSDWTDPLKLFELIVSMSQSDRWVVELSGACWGPNPTTRVPSCMVCGPESSGALCSTCASIDPSCMVLRPGFSYKLGQLSSSNKNSGKHKLSPSIQKKLGNEKTETVSINILQCIFIFSAKKLLMLCYCCIVNCD